MTKRIHFPEAQLNDCREFLRRHYDDMSRDGFEEALKSGEYDPIVQGLQQLLSTRDEDGMRCGRLGTPSERFAAESIIKRLQRAGYGLPEVGLEK